MTATMTSGRYRLALLVCFGTIILAILDQNIVSAALVPITSDLDPEHGLDLAPWVITAFSLAGTTAVPLYGKLCDLYGPRRVFVGVVSVFVLGSVLCGTAQTMLQLVLFRAIQGLGAGGLIAVTMVVAAYLSMLKPGGGGKKKKNGGSPTGLAGIVFVVGMTAGPPIGGLFADHGVWRWVFYVNLPLGFLILAGALAVFRFPRKPATPGIDYPGAALAGAFAICLLLGADWAGERYAWTSPVIIGLGLAALISLALFLWRQATASSPIMPLSLFRIATVRNSYAIQILQGMALTGVIVYLLMYLQVVRGVSATSTGAFLVFLAGGILVSGLVGERLDLSMRTAMVTGTSTAAVALVTMYATTETATSTWWIRGELVLLGLGFGLMVGRLITAVQQAVPRPQMGVGIAGIRFFQLLGGATGAAVLGMILRRVFEAGAPGVDMTAVSGLTGPVRQNATAAFTDGLTIVFAVAAAFMALAVLFSTRLRGTGRGAGEPEAAGPRPEGTAPARPLPGQNDRETVAVDAEAGRER